MAAYGVVLYISYIFLAVFLGYSISMNPVVGCNYGSKNRKEIRNILIKSLVLNAITGAAMTAVAEGCASVFSEVFVGYDSGLRSLTTTALRLYSLCFIFSGINIFASSFFTGLNDGLDSAVISFSRSLVFEVVAVYLLPMLFGQSAIWLAMLASEILSLAVTSALLMLRRNKYGYGKTEFDGATKD